ncbi:uncharacterized protein FOMMEDRAFT_131830 [Fomitiporia mediterranea MF3/22]|uniref:uncharacterized protein n=1 Tax=Fomitiporia mediterranea (strain MF3/22) TaxID=694068 RepID=UPI0004409898|nr:uncharacterized protein FOMMEDRAFT_131830 [Fomitiporia mediterranea MF3/22]EJD07123.1 hypothetical protein FOMMEDRAFT_131830 [Fomitiporia mediterranea MF3/22]
MFSTFERSIFRAKVLLCSFDSSFVIVVVFTLSLALPPVNLWVWLLEQYMQDLCNWVFTTSRSVLD